jgi:hypothetical protein
MGVLWKWEVERIKDDHGLKIAIETGTGCPPRGALFLAGINDEKERVKVHAEFENDWCPTREWGLNDIKPFEEIYTVELVESSFNKYDFSSVPSVRSHLGHSADVLPKILEDNKDVPTFFWLDAHLPTHHHDGDENKKDEIELPLESELTMIVEHKNVSGDVLIIDDLRIYEEGAFEEGNWADRHQFSNSGGSDFVYRLFEDTHNITKSFSDTGYLILTPLVRK